MAWTAFRRGRLLAGLLALIAIVSSVGAADVWRQSRHDATLSGRSAEAAVTDPVIQWMSDTGSPLAGEPVVVGCAIYVTTGTGDVMALNAHDGTTQWSSSRTSTHFFGALRGG